MKPMTLDEIKAFLDSGNMPFTDGEVIDRGIIEKNGGESVEYVIERGWDLVKAHRCDKQWGIFNLQLLGFVRDQNYEEAKLRTVLQSIQMDDSHWRWLTKSLVYRSSEYQWFFLMAENEPQAACLIYHPKESVLSTGKIFYIEYIAAAPWNRINPMAPRVFKGAGSLIIKAAMTYATGTLKLTQGFSLHAIPRAVSFYESIGMVPHEPSDKEVLKYFEMPEARAIEFGAVR